MKTNIIAALKAFRFDVEYAPGHKHLYAPFDEILSHIAIYHGQGSPMDEELAKEILAAVALLLQESSQGRRPWSSGWEDYFTKCLQNAHRLLLTFSKFDDFRKYVPLGFCKNLDFALSLDRYAEDLPESWYNHFLAMTVLASEMFKLVADETAQVNDWLLENPDDRFFTNLLTGYAQTGKAKEFLHRYITDDEAWVRNLAQQLLEKYY